MHLMIARALLLSTALLALVRPLAAQGVEYAPGTTRNYSWGYHAERPAAVVDPTPRLQSLAQSGQRLLP